MKTIALIIITVFIQFPDETLPGFRYYTGVVDRAFDAYCFAGIEHRYTSNPDSADLIIRPHVFIYGYSNVIGYANGRVTNNPKFFRKPEILLSHVLDSGMITGVLVHELYHTFVGAYHNTLDERSLMFPEYRKDAVSLSRHDSLYFLANFLYDPRVGHIPVVLRNTYPDGLD